MSPGKALWTARLAKARDALTDIRADGFAFPVRVKPDREPNNWRHFDDGGDAISKPWLTREAYRVDEQLDALHWAYNFDGSDSQSDHFHVRYYGQVSVDGEEAPADYRPPPVKPFWFLSRDLHPPPFGRCEPEPEEHGDNVIRARFGQ